MEFNETLAQLRKEHGYTQEQLAEKLNVSRQAVARWEAGETAPDVYILQKICGIFGVSADDILNGTPPKPAKVEFAVPPESEPLAEPAAAAAVKTPLPLKVKLIFGVVLAVILAASVLIHLAIIRLGTAWGIKQMKSDSDESSQPKIFSLSYTYENEFWTADEYEKWSKDQLEYYREMYESGKKLWWYTEDGDKVCKALTEDDLKSIEKSLDDTLKDIIAGNLYTKDEVISWTAPDGQTYSATAEEVYVIGEDKTAFEGEVSETFLIYNGNVAMTEESVAMGDAEAGGRSYEEVFEPYKKYGVEYREENGEKKLYFNGAAVSKFLDLSPDGGVFVFISDGGGEIDVQTVYDVGGELIGVKEIAE